MKFQKIATTVLFVTITLAYTFAQDTMYVMQKEGGVLKLPVANIDSVIFYSPFSSDSGTVTDPNGNIYKTVKIGDQEWMAENLKATKYADGTEIPHVIGDNAWVDLDEYFAKEKAYCFYNNNESPGYGALYTYYAAVNGDESGNKVQGVCPTGWHVPSDAEWKILEMYLGMNESDADDFGWSRGTTEGEKLKAAEGWSIIGNEAGKVGFSALASGFRNYYWGRFINAGYFCSWWTSTKMEYSSVSYGRDLDYSHRTISRSTNYTTDGFSVRCLRD